MNREFVVFAVAERASTENPINPRQPILERQYGCNGEQHATHFVNRVPHDRFNDDLQVVVEGPCEGGDCKKVQKDLGSFTYTQPAVLAPLVR